MSTNLLEFQVLFLNEVEVYFKNEFGIIKWNEIKKKLCLPPKYTAARINTFELSKEDIKNKLDMELNNFNTLLIESNRKPIETYFHPILSDIIIIPSSNALTNITKNQMNPLFKNIIIDRLCGEAVLRGSNIYARGIMAGSSGINENEEVNIYVDLDHLTTRGSDYNVHKGRKLFIGIGFTYMSRSQMFHETKGLAIKVLMRVIFDAPSLNNIMNNYIYIQNLPCAIISRMVEPKEGDTILDMCAAPGGKTSHIAILMKNKGNIIACDRSKKKVKDMQTFFKKLGLTCITPIKMDSRHSVKKMSETNVLLPSEIINQAKLKLKDSNSLLDVKGFYAETFDKILLDPPCSALGLRPRLLHSVTLKELDQYVKCQKNLFWAAIYLLKPGGTLVYSTCTFNPAENEKMVFHVLQTYLCMELIYTEPKIGKDGLLNQCLTIEETKKVQRFDPSCDKLDTGGYFCAKFKKKYSIRNKNNNKGEIQIEDQMTL